MSDLSTADAAAVELARLGEDPSVSAAIVDSIRAFMAYGHSGGSAEVAISHWGRLIRRETLTALTSDPSEWEDRSEMSSRPLWQNRRDPRAFSRDAGQTCWFVSPRHPGERTENGLMVVCARCDGRGVVEVADEGDERR